MWQELIIRNTIDGVGNYTYTVTAEAGEAVLLNEGTRTLYRIEPWGTLSPGKFYASSERGELRFRNGEIVALWRMDDGRFGV
ncbi:Uncharacterised protein [Mycobacteroides abscessus subsp. bolletii]|nr:Uncharacterised protein [Mycobacteroides abscessus]SKF61030.1 Uncharacterised protein [Mycobacteroides abscessus subsp. bolletii]SKH65587.1 Uncharacterised protein [Mycobacteroides abscessus subsp. bolletii]